jgi:predicted membrane protein
MSYCIKYRPEWYNFIFVLPSDVQILCSSEDKTRLFIVIFIRIIIYLTLFEYFYNKHYTNFYMFIQLILLIACLLMISINTLLLIYVVVMPQLYKKNIANSIIEKKEFIPRQWYDSLLEKEQPTCQAGTFKSR